MDDHAPSSWSRRAAALLCTATLLAAGCNTAPPPQASAPAERPKVAPATYAEAFRFWSQTRGDADERAYAESFQLFTKQQSYTNPARCQDLGPETVRMLLVIDRSDRGIVVTRALTANDGLKPRCVADAFRGIVPPPPPYLPFIVQMDVA